MRCKELEISGFDQETKIRIRENQGYKCAECGTYDENLPIHHIVPRSLGGSNIEINGVGLCNSSGNKCHTIYDQLVKEDGICFGNEFLSDMPDEFFARKENPYKNKEHVLTQAKDGKRCNLDITKKIYNDWKIDIKVRNSKEKNRKDGQVSVV